LVRLRSAGRLGVPRKILIVVGCVVVFILLCANEAVGMAAC